MADYQVTISIGDKELPNILSALRIIHPPQHKEKDVDYVNRIVQILLINAAHDGLLRQAAQRIPTPDIST